MDLRKLFQINRWTTAIFQLTLPIALYLGIQEDASWHWWAGMIFFYIVVYSLVGNNIGLHRYFTHKHFEVIAPFKWLFAWTGTMSMLGEPLSYAMTHIVHHNPTYTDTDLDPHGRIRGLKSVLIYFQKTVDVKETPVFNRRIIDLNARYRWMHQYYWLLVLGTAFILYLIDYKVMLFLWWLPASASCWLVAWTVVRQHLNYTPNNSPIHKIDFVYEVLHLNHHLHPMAPNTAIHPGEIDWAYQFSKLLKPKYDFRMQPGYKNAKQ